MDTLDLRHRSVDDHASLARSSKRVWIDDPRPELVLVGGRRRPVAVLQIGSCIDAGSPTVVASIVARPLDVHVRGSAAVAAACSAEGMLGLPCAPYGWAT